MAKKEKDKKNEQKNEQIEETIKETTNDATNETVEEKRKINFFKKFWYSITKIKKYDEMAEEGLGRAIEYFLILVLILGVILGGVATYIQSTVVNDAIKYTEDNLPELTFANNELNIDTEDSVILDGEEFITFFGYKVVINPYLERQQAIDEYYKLTTKEQKCLVFLNNEAILISSDYNVDASQEEQTETPKGVEVYTYEEHASKYLTDTSKEYKKQDIIHILNESISYEYYFCGYVMVYIITLLIFYLLYVVTIALTTFLLTKAFKIDEKLKQLFIKTFYAITLSAILYVVYALITYFANITIPYADVIDIVIAYMYIGVILGNKKKEQLDNQYKKKETKDK